MSFLWPGLLAILGLMPLFGLLYWLLQQERQLGPRHSRVGLVAAAGRPGLRRYVPPAFFLAALALLVAALARPQVVRGQSEPRGSVLLVFDVSASMAATDNAPTRLEAAKAAAKALVLQRPAEIDVGLVAFNNAATLQVPPTADPEALLAAIDRLVPERGTSLGQGLLEGLNVLAPLLPPAPTAPGTAPAVIVLFTDGENKLNPEPLEAALVAVSLGVRVHPVAYGSLEGTLLSLDGFMVHTELEDEVLRTIAALTGGTYYDGSVEPDLAAVYRGVATRPVNNPEQLEVTAWFVAAALVVALAGAGFSLVWFGRLP